jgi:uncharacterized membrane protein YedE/YeeE
MDGRVEPGHGDDGVKEVNSMSMWTDAALGGAMIGLATAGLLLVDGRIAGVSGILSNALRGTPGVWRWGFLLGLIAAPAWALMLGLPAAIAHHQGGPVLLVVAGLLVGAGTDIGSGCTSGHGICGMSNLSPRSIVATATFMLVAMVTVFFVRHVVPVFVGG